jgi:hypothetical protein
MRLKTGISLKAWIVIAGVAVVLAIIVLPIVNNRPSIEPGKQQPAPSAPAEPPSTVAPNADHADATRLVIAGQSGTGCEPEKKSVNVTVKELGGRDIFEAYDKGIFLMDEQGNAHKYYLDVDSVPEANKPQLPDLFAVGRRLDVQYVVCGSGGLRFLTYVQARTAQ